MKKTTAEFGFETVAADDKKKRVADVFDSVASKYDLMNDLMSVGLHRRWKNFAVSLTDLPARLPEDAAILDLAGGTGDLTRRFLKKYPKATAVLTDINNAMLQEGRKILLNRGIVAPVVQCNAEALPFPDKSFHAVSIGFGLRNITDKEKALREMRRVLKPGGMALVLEFSRVWKPLAPLYDFYSFKVLPKLGHLIANDEASYRYLAESIRMHPDQETLKTMMLNAGFDHVDYYNLTAGVVAVHIGRVR
ncbi:MAG: class I SAM-dependent methyltransferase [Burkholderiales bacterium]|jgi:demethylmenaquinone methyltransferase/2-methoxy-6-polyprenyl-1,4-benzoquinol methylase|nr:class I SAM-dependent methyltransferase [Burkholderiales bacterium]